MGRETLGCGRLVNDRCSPYDFRVEPVERSLWVECRPSPLTKTVIPAVYSINVGNLCDTGHSTEPTPPAAMTELLSERIRPG